MVRFVLFLVLSNLFLNEGAITYNFTQKFIRIFMKTLYCNEVNFELVHNATCLLKPTRDGGGLTTVMLYGLKPTSDLWIQFTVYYKSPNSVRYGPSVFEVNDDYCKMSAGSSVIPFVDAIRDKMRKLMPDYVRPCPVSGKFGFENLNLRELWENVVPQVIPTGTWKGITRFYLAQNNVTIFVQCSEAEVKAVDKMRTFELGK